MATKYNVKKSESTKYNVKHSKQFEMVLSLGEKVKQIRQSVIRREVDAFDAILELDTMLFKMRMDMIESGEFRS